MECRKFCWPVYLIGLGLGIITALLWLGGYVTGVRFMIPYAAAYAMLVLALTVVIVLVARYMRCDNCFHPYTIITVIAATIFMIFALIYVGTALTYTLKVILAFIGALSFGMLLLTFSALLIRLINRPS